MSTKTASSLHKVLRLSDLVLYGVGGTVGAGIFVSIGIGAAQAGPALCLSFLLAACACAISGMCFSEMASRVPVTGSSYAYTLVVLGRFPAFLIGSIIVIDSVISAAACARAWSAYLSILFPLLSPLSEYPLFSNLFSFSLLSGLICIALGLLMATGIRETTSFNNVSTILNMIVLTIFVIAGIVLFNAANYSPFAPNGFEGVVKGSGRIFFAFLGFDVINCLVEETQTEANGSRVSTLVPRAILYTIGITTIVYLLVCISFMGLSPISAIDLSSPLSSALSVRGETTLAFIVGVGAVGNTLTSIISNFLVQPRIVMGMAKDEFIAPWFGYVDSVRGVPRNALFVCVVLSAITAFFVDFETLADMVSVGSLVSLSVVCICSVIVRQQPSLVSRGSTTDELTPISPTSVPREQTMSNSVVWKMALTVYLSLSVVLAVLLLHPLASATVFQIVLFATVLSFVFACLELSKLFNTPEDQRPVFRVPLSPYLPLLGVFVNTYMLVGLPFLALVRGACVFGACSVFYVIKVRGQTDLSNNLPKPAPTYDSMDSSPRVSN